MRGVTLLSTRFVDEWMQLGGAHWGGVPGRARSPAPRLPRLALGAQDPLLQCNHWRHCEWMGVLREGADLQSSLSTESSGHRVARNRDLRSPSLVVPGDNGECLPATQ